MFGSETAKGWPSCPEVCREGGAEAERWGCHNPIPETLPAIVEIECFVCGGRQEKCTACGDEEGKATMRIPIRRCPHRLMGERERMVCRTLAFMESGILPEGSGWANLPAPLVDAIGLVSREKEAMRKKPTGD